VNASPGMVYLVGAGPGDPGLLTLRGKACLERADCVLHDALANEALLRLAPDAEHVFVGKRGGGPSMGQDAITALLIEKARTFRHVVRLKGGDPFVFGRGGEEALALAAAGIPFEVVPGVTSGIAGPACAGIPVTHRGLSASVTLVTGHRDPEGDESFTRLDRLAIEGTLVFYMGVRGMPAILEELARVGRPADTPAAVVEWGTRPCQRVASGTLATILERCQEMDIRPPSVLVVGEVAALRDELAWFERRPLSGLRVVITRARDRAGVLAGQLADLGAEVLEFPVIATAPGDSGDNIALPGRWDWVVLTSVNAAEALGALLDARGLDARALAGARFCAIGSATADALRGIGLRPDCVPAKFDAEHLLAALRQTDPDLTGKRVLFPRSDIAHRFLPEALRGAGAELTEWVAYRTVCPEVPEKDCDAVAAYAPDVVVFTSSSTAVNFRKVLGPERFGAVCARATFAALGPVTAAAARDCGADPAIVPEQSDLPSLVAAMLAWRARHGEGGIG
jgi:uroporphyrinogen III methyltransferase / synthase